MATRPSAGGVVLALGLAASAAAGASAAAVPPEVTRVSVAPDGSQLDAASRLSEVSSLSAHGERVAFQTPASLVAEDTNATDDVYLRDRDAGTTTLVTVDDLGIAAGGGSATVSHDGTRVGFLTRTSLVPEDGDDDLDAYVRDLTTGSTVLVSGAAGGLTGRGEPFPVELSGDGRTAVLLTPQRLVRRDQDSAGSESWRRLDVYAVDVATQRPRLVSVDGHGRSFGGQVRLGGVSTDGRRVGFSTTPDAAADAPPGYWVRNLDRDRSRLVWRENMRRLSFALPGTPALSGNGRFVALVSALPRVDDERSQRELDLIRLDLRTGRTVVVCCAEGTRYADAVDPLLPVVSGGGRKIAFELDSGAVAGDDDPGDDVYLIDLGAGPRLRLISRSASGPVNDASGVRGHSISADGRHVAFSSYADDVVAGDTNDLRDVFVWSDAP